MNETPLKKVLDKRGLKQKWLAQEVRVVSTTMSRIVTGKFEPSLKTALRIARALNLTVEDLWGHLADEEGGDDRAD